MTPMVLRRAFARILLVLLGVALFGALAFLYFSRPSRLTPILLTAASERSGLLIDTRVPAEIVYRPMPRLRLHGLRASAAEGGAAIVEVDRIDIALPWRTLFGDAGIEIESLHIDGLRLDLPAAQVWWDTRSNQPGTSAWPSLTNGLEIEQSTVSGGTWALSIEHFSVTRFAAAMPFAWAFDGELRQTPEAADDRSARTFPLHLRAGTTIDGSPEAFTATLSELQLAPGDHTPALQAQAEIRTDPTFAATMDGSLRQFPADWPAVPGFTTDQPWLFSLQADAPKLADASWKLSLELNQAQTRLQLRAPLDQLSSALSRTEGSPIPELVGSWKAAELQVDGLKLEGVELRVQPDENP